MLKGRLNHQLLSDSSTTCPAFISLHSPLKTQVRKSATGTAASSWLCKAHTCQWPKKGKETGFPGTSEPLLAGSAEPVGWGSMTAKASLQGCYYCSENGRFLTAGQRKTSPKLNNTQCPASPIKTSPIVSAPCGVGQINLNPNSAVFKGKAVSQTSSNPKFTEHKRAS